MPLILYHVDWCPECEVVRQKLAELGMPYEAVTVPDARPMRTQVYEVSGQYYVPVLKDGETVLTETWDIVRYLDEQFGPLDRTPGEADDGGNFPSCTL